MSAQIQILQEYSFAIEISLSNVLQTRHNLNAGVLITSKQLLKALHSFFIRRFYVLHMGDRYGKSAERENKGKVLCGTFNTFQTLPMAPENPTSPVSTYSTLSSSTPPTWTFLVCQQGKSHPCCAESETLPRNTVTTKCIRAESPLISPP